MNGTTEKAATSSALDDIVAAIHGYLTEEGFNISRSTKDLLTLPSGLDNGKGASLLRFIITDAAVVVWLDGYTIGEVLLADPQLFEILKIYCGAWVVTDDFPSLRRDQYTFRNFAKEYLNGRAGGRSGPDDWHNRRVRLPSGFLRPGED